VNRCVWRLGGCWITNQPTNQKPNKQRVLGIDIPQSNYSYGRLRLKCDGTRAETRFRVSAKRTSPFKSAVASVQSTTGSRGVRITGSNAGYTMLRSSVKSTGYQLHSPVSPSLPLPCVAVCHYVSTGLYVNDCNHLTSMGPCIVIIF
jgi:hypothetical protein